MPSDPFTVVTTLAEWMATVSYDAIPSVVREIAKGCLIDTVGVVVAGSQTSVAQHARSLVSATAAVGTSQIIGHPERVAAPAAAFANGCAAHALDFDDNSYAGFVHGSAVIVPAALAVGQAYGSSGRQLLEAVVAGAEIQFAVGMAATNWFYEKGWWSTGVLGPIGAAVAAAHLARPVHRRDGKCAGPGYCWHGRHEGQLRDRREIVDGRPGRRGRCNCRNARAIRATGPLDAFEHRAGFAQLFTAGTFTADLLGPLGRTWRLLTPGIDIKRMPVCLSSHAAVDAAADLVQQQAIPLGRISRIVCDVPPVVVANLIYDRPRNRQEAQFSMPFAVAASLQFGGLKLDHLKNEAWSIPEVDALMRNVEMQPAIAGRRKVARRRPREPRC
jgi:2-methylcitrate dehydratase PrpD